MQNAPSQPGTTQPIRGAKKKAVVCLCGSTRNPAAFQAAEIAETLADKIVLTVNCNTRLHPWVLAGKTQSEIDAIFATLDEQHRQKIEMSDEVLILNVGGYIGTSTQGELDYAISLGKKVRYSESVVIK